VVGRFFVHADTFPLFATAAKGTEGLLRDELRERRFRGVKATRGGVAFEGTLTEALRACLELRIAQRILVQLASFSCASADDLYEGVRAFEWHAFTTTKHTIAVHAEGRAEGIVHTGFAAQKVKDAICDTLRTRFGERPNVDRDDPDLPVFVLLKSGQATIYADASGEPLFKRGYRLEALEAPLKETLAAAIVRWSGYRGEGDFVDPMCGSGTLAIEAAMLARNIAPGLARARFAVERFMAFGDSERTWSRAHREKLRAEADLAREVRVLVADADPEACGIAKRNAERAGVTLRAREAFLDELELPRSGATLVTNPPYGERLELDASLLRGLERLMRLDWRSLHVLAGSESVQHALRARATRYLDLANGDLPVRLLSFE
jgi:putative N6-adenine-specific DNA methylase